MRLYLPEPPYPPTPAHRPAPLASAAQCHLPTTSPTGGLPLVAPMFLLDRKPDPGSEEAALQALEAMRRREALLAQAARQRGAAGVAGTAAGKHDTG